MPTSRHHLYHTRWQVFDSLNYESSESPKVNQKHAYSCQQSSRTVSRRYFILHSLVAFPCLLCQESLPTNLRVDRRRHYFKIQTPYRLKPTLMDNIAIGDHHIRIRAPCFFSLPLNLWQDSKRIHSILDHFVHHRTQYSVHEAVETASLPNPTPRPGAYGAALAARRPACIPASSSRLAEGFSQRRLKPVQKTSPPQVESQGHERQQGKENRCFIRAMSKTKIKTAPRSMGKEALGRRARKLSEGGTWARRLSGDRAPHGWTSRPRGFRQGTDCCCPRSQHAPFWNSPQWKSCNFGGRVRRHFR